MTRGAGLVLGALLLACSGKSGPARAPAPPRPVSAIFQDGEVLAYRITDRRGGAIGRTRGTFSAGEGTLRLVTRVSIEPQGGTRETTEHAIALTRGFEPSLYKRLSSQRGRFEIRFGERGLDLVSELGTSQLRRDPVRAPIYVPEDMMLLALLIHRSAVVSGKSEVLDVFVPEVQSSEPLSFTMWTESDGRLVVETPAGRAELDERWHVRRFESRDHDLVFELEPEGGPPIELSLVTRPSYVRPHSADWDDREVQVEVNGGSLQGLLSVPRRRARWAQKLAPSVLFISDRGAQDRFGHAGPVDRGTWAFQDRLALEGFVVLRLDDRGVAPGSPPPLAQPGPLGRAPDAEAALRFLTRVPESDHQRVVLVGHGEGALLAARLAAAPEAAALVMIAPRYRGLEAEWNEAIAGLDRPVLVLVGLEDFEVSWKEEAEVLFKRVESKLGKARAKLAAFDRVDHWMKEEPKTSTEARYQDPSRLVDERVVETFSEWIQASVPGL